MTKTKSLKEIAAGGSVGAGSIAANPSGDSRREKRHGEDEWRSGHSKEHTAMRNAEKARSKHTQEQLAKAKAAKKKRSGFRGFISRLVGEGSLNEAFDISGTVSKLKGLENKNNNFDQDLTTYGVEDDEGNVMKITVKSEEAKDFEARLATELGELEDNKIYGYDRAGISLAELLFNLRDEFDIVDVEFPEIPSDVIYNADKATHNVADTTNSNDEITDEFAGEMDTDITGNNNNLDNPDMDNLNGPNAMGDENDLGSLGLEDNTDLENSDDGLGNDLENPDAENDLDVENFEDEEAGGTDSIFQSLIKMMTAQAKAEEAKAQAETEKARALTAELTAKAANGELAQQEELARMEADLDEQKEKKKNAQKLAQLAKYRVQQAKGAPSNVNQFENFKSFLKVITEENDAGGLETEQDLRRQLTTARTKYQINAGDSTALQAYKRIAWQAMNQIINSKLKMARAYAIYQRQTATDNTTNQSPNAQNTGNAKQQNVAQPTLEP